MKSRLARAGVAGVVVVGLFGIGAGKADAEPRSFHHYNVTQKVIWTFSNQSFKPVFAVSPWGYFRGFCIVAGWRWDILRQPEGYYGALEVTMEPRAMDADGGCTIHVAIPRLASSIRGGRWDPNFSVEAAPFYTATGPSSRLFSNSGMHAGWYPPTALNSGFIWDGDYETSADLSWTMPNGVIGNMPTLWSGRTWVY